MRLSSPCTPPKPNHPPPGLWLTPASFAPPPSSIKYGRNKSVVLQDALRLLTIWFDFGHLPEVERVLEEGLEPEALHSVGGGQP